MVRSQIPVGARLAREGVRPANINIDHDPYHFDSQPRFADGFRPAYSLFKSLIEPRISIMGKRHPNLPAWQWRTHPHNHQDPTNPVLHLIAVPLFIVAFLLMVSGVFSLDLASIAIGVIGLLAALGLQRHGHRL
jgi:hypothetical protein